jgi:mRNA interferase YafQ
MAYQIEKTGQFKKYLKLAIKRKHDISELNTVVDMLANGVQLPEKYQDHSLGGNWVGFRECHISPDWLLIYKIKNEILVLSLVRTGTHSDLFKK